MQSFFPTISAKVAKFSSVVSWYLIFKFSNFFHEFLFASYQYPSRDINLCVKYRIFVRIGRTFLHRTQGYEKGVRPIYECRNKRSLTSSAQATKRSQIDDQPLLQPVSELRLGYDFISIVFLTCLARLWLFNCCLLYRTCPAGSILSTIITIHCMNVQALITINVMFVRIQC